MGIRWILYLSLLAPLAAAPALANSSPASVPAPIAKAKPPSAQTTGKVDKLAPRKSRERIYTYKPRPEPEAEQARDLVPSRVIMTRNDLPFVGFSPVENSVMGIGLWRVPKVNRNDPNRGSPLRDRRGKTSRAAAVGFQLAF